MGGPTRERPQCRLSLEPEVHLAHLSCTAALLAVPFISLFKFALNHTQDDPVLMSV